MCVWSARFGRNSERKERRKEKQYRAECGEELLLEGERGVWFVIEWHGGKDLKKHGERAQGKIEDIGYLACLELELFKYR